MQIKQVQDMLWQPYGLTQSQCEGVLGTLFAPGVTYADLYFQASVSEYWALEDGQVKDGQYDRASGVGLRAIRDETTGFAYAEQLTLPALTAAAKAARSIVQSGQSRVCPIKAEVVGHNLYPGLSPLGEAAGICDADKLALLRAIDVAARQADARVTQVEASLSGQHEAVLMMNAEGVLSADLRPLVRLDVRVIVDVNGRREQGHFGCGGRHDYAVFLAPGQAAQYAQAAVRQALVNLEARPAPAGAMPVVLGPGWPGVLLHEAIGHGLEGDFNRKGSSAFAGQVGEQVASPLCTVVDDGQMPGRRGSLNVDDEGVPTQQTVLIENGRLVQYMQDRHNAMLMGVNSTGNGRRESYAHLPMPRMTNTYMLSGEDDPEAIIGSVADGLYAVNFDGGQVDITSGKFVFSANEAYRIKAGKIAYPVKGATLIGSGPEVLTKVSRVGNDLALDQGIGVCGKEGQSVPVGVGQPTLLVDEITVGGTEG